MIFSEKPVRTFRDHAFVLTASASSPSDQIGQKLWRSKIWVHPVVTTGALVRRRLLDAGVICQRVAIEYTEGSSAFQAPRRLDGGMRQWEKSTRKPRADAVRNRERVLKAAKVVFGAGGAEASLEAVGRAAGVGIGTL